MSFFFYLFIFYYLWLQKKILNNNVIQVNLMSQCKGNHKDIIISNLFLKPQFSYIPSKVKKKKMIKKACSMISECLFLTLLFIPD